MAESGKKGRARGSEADLAQCGALALPPPFLFCGCSCNFFFQRPLLSCTSQPRTWGIPSRRIEPDRPVEDIDFKKVPEAVVETFDDPVQAKEDDGKDSGSCSEADEVDLQRQKELLESFADEEKPMLLLR